MSEGVTTSTRPGRPPLRRRRVLCIAIEAVVVVAVFAAAGAAAGWLWYTMWDSPPGVAFQGEWIPQPYDSGNRSIFGATATFVVLGGGAGLVLGVLAGLICRGSELVTLVATLVGTALAAWLAYRVGVHLSPPDPGPIAAKADDYTKIAGDLRITGRSPFVCWTSGGLLGLAATYFLTSGYAESRRRESDDPAWLSKIDPG